MCGTPQRSVKISTGAARPATSSLMVDEPGVRACGVATPPHRTIAHSAALNRRALLELLVMGRSVLPMLPSHCTPPDSDATAGSCHPRIFRVNYFPRAFERALQEGAIHGRVTRVTMSG